MRWPAETFAPGTFIRDEMQERGMSLREAHRRLGNDPARCCAFDLAAYCDDKELILGEATARDLEIVFGIDAQTWLNLDSAWRGH